MSLGHCDLLSAAHAYFFVLIGLSGPSRSTNLTLPVLHVPFLLQTLISVRVDTAATAVAAVAAMVVAATAAVAAAVSTPMPCAMAQEPRSCTYVLLDRSSTQCSLCQTISQLLHVAAKPCASLFFLTC